MCSCKAQPSLKFLLTLFSQLVPEERERVVSVTDVQFADCL